MGQTNDCDTLIHLIKQPEHIKLLAQDRSIGLFIISMQIVHLISSKDILWCGTLINWNISPWSYKRHGAITLIWCSKVYITIWFRSPAVFTLFSWPPSLFQVIVCHTNIALMIMMVVPSEAVKSSNRWFILFISIVCSCCNGIASVML